MMDDLDSSSHSSTDERTFLLNNELVGVRNGGKESVDVKSGLSGMFTKKISRLSPVEFFGNTHLTDYINRQTN